MSNTKKNQIIIFNNKNVENCERQITNDYENLFIYGITISDSPLTLVGFEGECRGYANFNNTKQVAKMTM